MSSKEKALRFVFTEWMNKNPLNSPNLVKIVNIKNKANRNQQLRMMGRHLNKKSSNLSKNMRELTAGNITPNKVRKIAKIAGEHEIVLFQIKRIKTLLKNA